MNAFVRCAFVTAFLAVPSGLRAQSRWLPSWPTETEHGIFGTYDLVTVTEPAARHKCRVHAVSEESITCGGGFAAPLRVYPREQVAALIAPPNHGTALAFGACLAGFAGVATVSIVFIPIAPIAIATGALVGFTGMSCGLMFDDDNDHSDDRFVYRRAGSEVLVKMRK